jgi:hypothetical protein
VALQIRVPSRIEVMRSVRAINQCVSRLKVNLIVDTQRKNAGLLKRLAEAEILLGKRIPNEDESLAPSGSRSPDDPGPGKTDD